MRHLLRGGGAYFSVTAQGCGAYWEAVLIWGPAFIGGNTVGGPYVLALGNVSDHGSDRALVLIGICLILLGKGERGVVIHGDSFFGGSGSAGGNNGNSWRYWYSRCNT